MVLVLAVAVIALTLVTATGHLAQLTSVRLRAARLLVAAAVVQVGTATLAPGSGAVRVLALVVTVLLVGMFLGGNLTLPGIPLVAAGLLLNAAVILANGAMPVSVAAAARAGVGSDALRLDADPLREALVDGTRLSLLADRVPVPAPGWEQVVSGGDVLVAAGVGLLLVAGSVPRDQPAPRRRGRRGAAPARQADRRTERSMALVMESTTRGSYS